MIAAILRAVRPVAGLLIWSSCFVLIYAVASGGCNLGWQSLSVGPVSLLRLVGLTLWVLHLAAFVPLALADRRSHAHSGWTFTVGTTAAVDLSALVATLWTGLPLATLDICV